MEVGLRCVDGEQRQEMGRGEAIAAFIDVAAQGLTRKIGDAAVEQGGGRYDECHVPREFSVFQGNCIVPIFTRNSRFHQRRPTVGRLQRLGSGRLTVVAVFALADEQCAGAVAFYIKIRCWVMGDGCWVLGVG